MPTYFVILVDYKQNVFEIFQMCFKPSEIRHADPENMKYFL